MRVTATIFAPLLMGLTALAAESKPNFVVILTDDQDLRMNSMDYMPKLKKYVTDDGMFFNHHYATVALCCPSRASMWTGRAAHNTNVTDLGPPHGGFPKFIEEGLNKKWLPVWLQDAGYKTYFTGKLMNFHNVGNYKKGQDDMGLDGHDFMIEPGAYQYTNTTIQHNMEKPKSYPGVYATDLLANKSLAWIDKAAKDKSPFFLAINPINPHNNFNWNNGKTNWSAPIPAARHKDKFQDAVVPRSTSSFNPDKPSGASWVKQLKKLDSKTLKENDDVYRRRLQALQAVDDMVENTVAKLKEHNMLDNTYIIYTSDNGFHISQHRLTPGKRCPYEEDVNVPLVIRGPGVPKSKTVDFVTSHLDIAPTIVNWAGAKGPGDFDGKKIPANGSPGSEEPWEHVQVEHWGEVSSHVNSPLSGVINSYKAIRVIGPKYNLYYAVWCQGDHEVYDMINDPYQMKNLYNSTSKILGVSMQKVEDRLDALTLVTKSCKGDTCRRPWETLHPDGKVKSLVEALSPKFDSFYKKQNKVAYKKCLKEPNLKNESPIKFHTLGEQTIDARDLDGWMNIG
ncbi:alkaline-phosphatase-like protein [Penicillium alfredii]|uniref:Arylsulfatase n=1 Tax=Penicillium alfredii TaxID=1506179 RepID=A0A9W9G9A6_9EURO|nr:alkaline-phosphatase-like protein [Penicillium alfredii]KAJ5114357.1 alkaline-phosphatase-like protein [Penicillium alfredii]